jgi:hypothetical protein
MSESRSVGMSHTILPSPDPKSIRVNGFPTVDCFEFLTIFRILLICESVAGMKGNTIRRNAGTMNGKQIANKANEALPKTVTPINAILLDLFSV